MYGPSPSLLLGFHGCKDSVAEKILSTNKIVIEPSRNEYDWLGHGIYFWESNPARALDFAREKLERESQGSPAETDWEPAVVGALIEPGHCLNLLSASDITLVRDAWESLTQAMQESDREMPRNRSAGDSRDLLLRNLDCAVIESLHLTREARNLQPFDTVRGVFVEGAPIYPTAGFHEKSHIQICVRNPRCLKGFFRVLDDSF